MLKRTTPLHRAITNKNKATTTTTIEIGKDYLKKRKRKTNSSFISTTVIRFSKSPHRLVIVSILVSCILSFVSFYWIRLRQQEQEVQQLRNSGIYQPRYLRNIPKSNIDNNSTTNKYNYHNHSIAIIVAYRDMYKEQKRSEHLNKFIPHMIQFLNKGIQQKKLNDYHIYIIEQSANDGLKFNRGKLMNVGFDYAMTNATTTTSKKHDIFIFHDVDLLPNDDLLDWYTMYPTNPIHLAHPCPKYSNLPFFVGAIMSFNANDFITINGFPNNFWGWGGEDDEMGMRLISAGNIPITDATTGTFIDVENESIQDKMKVLQQHNNWRNPGSFGLLLEHYYTWKTNGLVDLYYSTKIVSIQSLDTISNKATKITTNLGLNKNHWTNSKASANSTSVSYYNMIVDVFLSYTG